MWEWLINKTDSTVFKSWGLSVTCLHAKLNISSCRLQNVRDGWHQLTELRTILWLTLPTALHDWIATVKNLRSAQGTYIALAVTAIYGESEYCKVLTMTKCLIFHPHLNSACAMFRVKRVNCHLRNDVRWIIYIYIYEKSTVQLASVGLAQARPNNI